MSLLAACGDEPAPTPTQATAFELVIEGKPSACEDVHATDLGFLHVDGRIERTSCATPVFPAEPVLGAAIFHANDPDRQTPFLPIREDGVAAFAYRSIAPGFPEPGAPCGDVQTYLLSATADGIELGHVAPCGTRVVLPAAFELAIEVAGITGTNHVCYRTRVERTLDPDPTVSAALSVPFDPADDGTCRR